MKTLNTHWSTSVICLIGTGITMAKLTPLVTFIAALLTCIIGIYTLVSIVRKEINKYKIYDKQIDKVEVTVNEVLPKNIFGSIGASSI